MSLDLVVKMTIGDGPAAGRPFYYTVGGLPPGHEATILETARKWQILRIRNGVSAGWSGNYASAEDALRALERELSEHG